VVTNTDRCYEQLLLTAQATSLNLGNHNDELIGIDFYQQLNQMNNEQLASLQQAWQNKRRLAQKEKMSAQFMIVQLTLLMLVAAVSAWLIAGTIGIITSLVGIIGLFIVIDSKRVTQAKKNLSDVEHLCATLTKANQRHSPN